MKFKTAGLLSEFTSTGLDNAVIGGKWNQRVSIRFRTLFQQQFEVLSGIRVYVINKKAGYAGGTGGKYIVTLHLDDGMGAPGSPICGGEGFTLFTQVNNGGFPDIEFPFLPVLLPNALYHVVFTNTDPDPVNNYISLDFLYDADVLDQDPNMAVLLQPANSKWGVFSKIIPSPVEIDYLDGSCQGNGWIGPSQCGTQYGFSSTLCQ